MPSEYMLLKEEPFFKELCPNCGARFPEFMRGMVQRPKRFLGVLWRQDYCAVICHECKNIIGWESPPSINKNFT